MAAGIVAYLQEERQESFFFLLPTGKKVSSFFMIIGKREMVEVDYKKQIFCFFIRMSDVDVETEAIMRDEDIIQTHFLVVYTGHWW